MNRHERRRASRLRRGYLHRLLAVHRAGALSAPGLHHVAVEHDRDCAIYRGGECDCVPDISISGPDGVTVVDANGVGSKRTRS